jgi:hypothetical protein
VPDIAGNLCRRVKTVSEVTLHHARWSYFFYGILAEIVKASLTILRAVASTLRRA